MPFAYFNRLSAAKKRIYLRSDSIDQVEIPAGLEVGELLAGIRAALEAEKRVPLERACQRLLDALTGTLQVPAVRVKIKAVRPSGEWGELHGLYEPGESGEAATISTWMRTVARKQPVAYKTFVRTLLHELCHHLDYELYGLAETFHTEGFYKREASLFRQLHGPAQDTEGPSTRA
jgi:hypothetical protein